MAEVGELAGAVATGVVVMKAGGEVLRLRRRSVVRL